ncbi:WD40-repeat-containing domain protein [Tricladium varicosporioides]|nr:WD40-repeat-containing domain protein [Hymenoscyphus varicosporioides]
MAGSENGGASSREFNGNRDLADVTGDETTSMDYEPTSEDSDERITINEAFLERLLAGQEEEDDEDDNSASEIGEAGGNGYTEIEVEIHEETNNDASEAEAERTARQRRQVIRLLANSEIGRLFRFTAQDDFDDDDDDDDFNPMWRRRRRQKPDPNRFPKVPSDEGAELMRSGTFGSNEAQDITSVDDDGRVMQKKKRLAKRILDRELATSDYAGQKLNNRLMAQGMIPASNADIIIHYNQPVYSGQFSDDGNFFFSANKDYHVRMYDTSNPYKWRYYKTVEYPHGQWTLTDASLSPDNKYLAYTSIRSQVCLAPTDPNDMGDPYVLDLSDMGGGQNLEYRRRFDGPFGIWSIRFSGDGRKLVAGAQRGQIVVYDIESRRTTHLIAGHEADVNAVCFADKLSPHLLYSGSDDTTLKVWDTRSMGDSREAGAFIGHIEGLTYIDSKGDGRYILSNGKDQSMKLWDLRMVMSPRDFGALAPTRRNTEPRFEYRWGSYDEEDWYKDPNDNSLVTFRGHRVLRTLIRCHFSPPGSTNSRYVYSGSEDGKIYIWNMDATLAGTVDVYSTTKNTRPPTNSSAIMGWDEDEDLPNTAWKTCVRDASWHPNAPIIVGSAWSGYGMSTGTCTLHSWNDGVEDDEAEPKMGLRVNEKLEVDSRFYQNTGDRRTFNTRFRGSRADQRFED